MGFTPVRIFFFSSNERFPVSQFRYILFYFTPRATLDARTPADRPTAGVMLFTPVLSPTTRQRCSAINASEPKVYQNTTIRDKIKSSVKIKTFKLILFFCSLVNDCINKIFKTYFITIRYN